MKVGLLFPGQGSQAPGMGRDLVDAFPVARRTFEEADDALGDPISTICFEGSADDLALTANTQPAILTVSVAALRALEAEGLNGVVGGAGHSLGEYSAHVAAGTIEFSDAVRTVRERGRLMQDAVPVGVGAMAAILGLDADPIDDICREAAGDQVVSAANLNSPGQIVIAGHADAVDRACSLAQERGARKAVRLPVSAPFHCALMKPAADGLVPVLERVTFRDPSWPVYANVDGKPVRGAARARELLVRQVVSPVRWIDVITTMLADGIRTFLEVGPGKVLGGLVKRIDRSASVFPVSSTESVADAMASLRETGGGETA